MENVKIQNIHPPLPLPVYPPNIELKVLTPETIQILLKEVEKGDKPSFVFIGMSWTDYLSLGQYFQKIKKRLEEDKILICSYREELKEVECIQ